MKSVISAQLAAPNRTAICLFEWPKWLNQWREFRAGLQYLFAEQWKLGEVCETVFISAVIFDASSGAEIT